MIAHLGKFTKKHWIVYLKQGMWCVSYTSIKWLRSTIPGLLCFWEVLKVVYRWGLWWVQQHIGHSMSLSCFLKDTSRDHGSPSMGPKQQHQPSLLEMQLIGSSHIYWIRSSGNGPASVFYRVLGVILMTLMGEKHCTQSTCQALSSPRNRSDLSVEIKRLN